jgi:Uma2 family endonuclease
MSVSLPPSLEEEIDYPESDGQPMADNTRQFQWIVVLYGNLAAWFRDDPNVFVSGNQFWYPVEGDPANCAAPDVYVVFGRPKGDRSSYKQWEEGGVPLTVVFEVLSPRNTFTEMDDKFAFYEDYGVEEYYVYDPFLNRLKVFLRRGKVLARVRPIEDFASPRLGIRFQMTTPEMTVFLPDGRRFLKFEELERERAQIQQRAARLAELSRQARQGQATPQELEELNRLEETFTSG